MDTTTQASKRTTQALEALREDIATVRTGRATTGLVENILIEVYNSRLPIKQLGGISIPDPRLIIINPWDPGTAGAIAKGILEANVGLTPTVDGTAIRINIPPMTQQRREQMIKLLSQKLEQGRIQIRQIRQEINQRIEREAASEDEEHQLSKALQEIVDQAIGEIAAVGEKKEAELREL